MTLSAPSACVGGRHVGRDGAHIKPVPRPPVIEPVEPGHFDCLSHRERETVEAYMRLGMGKLVAVEMGMTLKTFDAHIGSAMRKTGFKRSVLMLLAYQREQLDGKRQGGFE